MLCVITCMWYVCGTRPYTINTVVTWSINRERYQYNQTIYGNQDKK